MQRITRILLALCAALFFASALVLTVFLAFAIRAGVVLDGVSIDPVMRTLAAWLAFCTSVGAAATVALVKRRYRYTAPVVFAAACGLAMIGYVNLLKAGLVSASNAWPARWSLALASAIGDERARHILASIRLFATEDPKKQVLGFRQLQAEYEAGSAYAAGKLGWAYQKGRGTEADLARALELYEYAASRGMTYWQILLAHAYDEGYFGLSPSPERAAYWRERRPKIHIAIEPCWIASYYRDGTFPADAARVAAYERLCAVSTVESEFSDGLYCAEGATTRVVPCGPEHANSQLGSSSSELDQLDEVSAGVVEDSHPDITRLDGR